MCDHPSSPPSDSGAKQDSEKVIIAPSSSAADKLTLGFGMLEVASLEDKTHPDEVSLD